MNEPPKPAHPLTSIGGLAAAASGWIDYRSLQKDPRFDSLRSTPELSTFIDGLSARVAEMKNEANAK